MSKGSVAINIAGREYRIRSEADPKWLQQVAGHVDSTMDRVKARTGTVDSHDLAVLTALNIARELMSLQATTERSEGANPERLRSLIDFAESALGEA